MKKLRMIITSAIVLAIVGSAFAFNAKKADFCIDSDTWSGSPNKCDQVLHAKFIDPMNGTTFYYYIGWNGNNTQCTAPNNTNCPLSSSIKLSNNGGGPN